MTKSGIDLGGGAAENTVALNPLVGLAREDLIGAVGVMLRETTDPGSMMAAIHYGGPGTSNLLPSIETLARLKPA